MNNTQADIFRDPEKTGSYLLAKGLGKDHKSIQTLIEKYREDFEDIGAVEMRKLKSTGGRAAHEYMLTINHTAFLVALMKNSFTSIKLVKGVILKGDIISALNTIKNFDTDDISVKYVYAASDSQGRVKIGISNAPERRIKELNIGNADKLTLIYTKRADLPAYQSETKLHKKCKDYRIHGEWFNNKAMGIVNGK